MLRLTGRYNRPGEEAALAQAFVESTLPEPARDEEMRVFIEPRVDIRRPDIVAVYWRPKKATAWPAARRRLTELDLRLLQYLHLAGPQRVEDVAVRGTRWKAAVGRLQAADVVYVKSGRVHARSLTKTFAVTRIISVEAKVSSAMKAIEQASLNTLFSSQSYVLTAARSVTQKVATEASARGVGIWTGAEQFDEAVKPRRFELPQTYAAWLFNERAWRHHRA